jgi:nucleotide-binding universal stress UspA family protein
MSRYRSILVGVGPGAAGSAALDHAVALAASDGVRLTLLAAVGSPPAPTWWVPALPENPFDMLLHACEARLRRARQAVPGDVLVTTLLRHGEPAPALIGEVERGHHDLVVIGARAHAAWWRGRVRRAVVRHSPVPVLVAIHHAEGA